MIRGTSTQSRFFLSFLAAALVVACESKPSFTVEDSKVGSDPSTDNLDAKAAGAVNSGQSSDETVKCTTDEGETVCVDANGKVVKSAEKDSDGDGIPDSIDDDNDVGGGTGTLTSSGTNTDTGGGTGTNTGTGTGTSGGTSTGTETNTGTNTNTGTGTSTSTSTSTGTNTGTGTGTGTSTGTDIGGGTGTGTDTNPMYADANDTFMQNAEQNLPLDILVVVDNSGSMAEEQVNLGEKLTKILEFANVADWRIALRTTDAASQGINLLVEKSDQTKTFDDKKLLMQNTIQGFGIKGSGNEEGIPMSVRGLKASRPSTSIPWVREDSLVAVLIVSDEDNCSDGKGCVGEQNEASYLLNFLNKDSGVTNIGRTLGVSAKVYGLIRRSSDECTQAAYVGNKYMDAINGSGGIAGRICDADYSGTLSKISADLSTTLKIAFELAHVPVVETIQITVNGLPYAGTFILNNKTLQLSDAPPAGAQIAVTYRYQVN